MSKKQYYLVKRKDRLTDGKPTYYARFRDEDGELQPWRSTAETSKARAENWALGEIRAGRISIPADLTFSRYAERWWKWDECDYIRGKIARGKQMSRSHADLQRRNLEEYILPRFGDKKLARITPRLIEKWVLDLSSEHVLSPATVNRKLATLKVMLAEAFRLGIMPTNPALVVEHLKETPKEKGILSLDELRKLFDEKTIDSVWGGDLRAYSLNLLAAPTGLRMGEVQGLQVQHVHLQYVAVVNTWERKYRLKDHPKWNSAREVPIPSKTSRYLQQLISSSFYQEPDDLVFWGADGANAITHKQILKSLYHAFEGIGISPSDRKRRNLTFHSWRHLFNSTCRPRIPDYKLQRLTGHRTQEMTELYTHIQLEDFADVIALQEEMLA